MLILNLMRSALHLLRAKPQIPPMTQAEIEELLDREANSSGLKDIDWRNSVVDKFKLLGIDSSIENRTRVWGECGFKEEYTGSAAQNVLLNDEVTRRWANYERLD